MSVGWLLWESGVALIMVPRRSEYLRSHCTGLISSEGRSQGCVSEDVRIQVWEK